MELGKKTIDTLTNLPLVKSYNMEAKEEERYKEISDKRAGLEFHMDAVQKFISPFQEILTLFGVLILFGLMFYLVISEGRTDVSSFLVYFYLVNNSASKFGYLTNYRSYLADAYGPVEEVWEVLSDDGKYFVPSGSETFTGLRDSIEFKSLNFTFPGDKEVLTDLSFQIPKGSTLAIVGPTGAGKTTIINLLLRFYDCPPGKLSSMARIFGSLILHHFESAWL